ncbi:ATP-binding cassette domain-containing protein [Stappia sp. ES.058]|uniref:ATP-binding cassette domain-containing protein n=1 Tax=Stappia sp. ES.058 TaxID=1881061 RepID=UPI00087A3195|nr:ATP-binding cassette domain-containing protein [Stappia sp. ES.058]SDU31429.1 ABC-type bacteriocin/lantibiotic exporter, contains an N-terminal double-glycine peptidase domain [Stappia sp. ES.058]
MSNQAGNEFFVRSAERIETLLSDPRPAMSTPSPVLVDALHAAAAAAEVKLMPGSALVPGEPVADSIERLARAAGLQVRQVRLSDQRIGESPVPILALRKPAEGDAREDAPADAVLLTRSGDHWRVAEAAGRWKPGQAGSLALDDFEPTGYLVLPALPDSKLTAKGLLRFGLPQARKDLAAFFAFTLLAGMAVATLPLVTGPLFATIVPEGDFGLLANMMVFFAVLFGANLLTRFAAGIAKLRLDGRIGFFLRAAAIDRAIRIAEGTASTGGDLPPAPIAALSTRSVERWHRGVWGMALSVIAALLVALPNIAVVAATSATGAVVIGGVVVAVILAGGLIARRRVQALLSGLAAPQSWMSTAYEALTMIDTVRATASEGRVFSRWTDGFLSLRHRFLKADRVGAASSALEEAVEGALVLSAIVALALAGGVVAGGASISLVVAAGSIAGAVSAVLGAFGQATMLGLQFRMIHPLLDGVPRPAIDGWTPPPLSGAIECRDLVCRHRAGAPAALDGVSTRIEPGEHIGIAGPSGAGKSTLVKALLGLIPRESGSVTFDGFDLDRLDDRLLRRQIGIVGQGGRLFPGTLFDNISAGAPITMADAWEAAGKAGLEADIKALPLGFGTPVGDTECGFSGGQIQRILLARAFAAKPKILILDEATSALDPALQAHVAWAIDEMDATVISIAHRLETLKACDRILVLDRGRVAESGAYEDLLAGDGLFFELIEAQDAA